MFENILLQEKKIENRLHFSCVFLISIEKCGAVKATIMEGIFYTKFAHKKIGRAHV